MQNIHKKTEHLIENLAELCRTNISLHRLSPRFFPNPAILAILVKYGDEETYVNLEDIYKYAENTLSHDREASKTAQKIIYVLLQTNAYLASNKNHADAIQIRDIRILSRLFVELDEAISRLKMETKSPIFDGYEWTPNQYTAPIFLQDHRQHADAIKLVINEINNTLNDDSKTHAGRLERLAILADKLRAFSSVVEKAQIHHLDALRFSKYQQASIELAGEIESVSHIYELIGVHAEAKTISEHLEADPEFINKFACFDFYKKAMQHIEEMRCDVGKIIYSDVDYTAHEAERKLHGLIERMHTEVNHIEHQHIDLNEM